MTDTGVLDTRFREAVSAIDAGDVATLESVLAMHPDLVRDRLDAPGAWLRDQVGEAIDGFFRQPYLLWFVAEDPVRNGKLPRNIAQVAGTIIQAATRDGVVSLQEQIDHALRLVCWSWIARKCGVQIELIDVLIDAGASIDGRTVYQSRYSTHSDAAIYNGNFAAAKHLVERGAPLTLTTALCLGRWADVERLAPGTTFGEKQNAFVQAALNGNAEALRCMLALGVDPTTVSDRNQSHGTALHHAVWSGCLDAVRVLVKAGADLNRRDTSYGGTPLGWAMYGEQQQQEAFRELVNQAEVHRAGATKQYREIAAYLRELGGEE
jgi:peptide-methionine (S)-S-oxide reductase